MSGDKKKNTILVVDDSRVSLTHLVQILEGDYIVHTATSGVEVIQIADVVRPDIILLDIVMPQMNGYEALEKLQENLTTRDTPVIFITSLDQDSDEEKGLRLGAVDYISKPYNPTIVKLRVSVQLKIVEQLRTINHLSMMDFATEVPNRRYFDMRMKSEWQRAKSENHQLGLIFIDVDKLRTYNAIYGYAHGDKALITIANTISKVALSHPGDVVARWSDSTFVVLLQDATGGMCSTIAEDLRKTVENTEIKTSDNTPTNLTISLGANSVNPGSADCDMEQFITNADSALYLAKELGGNQVVVHS